LYSVILMVGMTAGADVPQGLLFNRGTGCTGQTQTIRVRVRETVADAPIRTAMANAVVNVNNARPHLFGRFLARVDARTAGWAETRAARATGCGGGVSVMRATGCAGSQASYSVTRTTTYTPVLLSTCPNGACPPQASVPEQPTALALGGGFIQRAAVHRTLHKALRQGKLTPEQAAVADRALHDPDIYEAAVTKVARDLNKQMAGKMGAEKVGAIGDGHLLQLLIDNLPAIINAIKQIIALFGVADPTVEPLPMPRGPYPPPQVVVDYWTAC